VRTSVKDDFSGEKSIRRFDAPVKMKTFYTPTRIELQAKKAVDLMPSPIRVHVNDQSVTLYRNFQGNGTIGPEPSPTGTQREKTQALESPCTRV
jgi:hypothetical protein